MSELGTSASACVPSPARAWSEFTISWVVAGEAAGPGLRGLGLDAGSGWGEGAPVEVGWRLSAGGARGFVRLVGSGELVELEGVVGRVELGASGDAGAVHATVVGDSGERLLALSVRLGEGGRARVLYASGELLRKLGIAGGRSERAAGAWRA